MREQVIQVVGQYTEALRNNDASGLPRHVCRLRVSDEHLSKRGIVGYYCVRYGGRARPPK